MKRSGCARKRLDTDRIRHTIWACNHVASLFDALSASRRGILTVVRLQGTRRFADQKTLAIWAEFRTKFVSGARPEIGRQP
jgi:hypothetical protein